MKCKMCKVELYNGSHSFCRKCWIIVQEQWKKEREKQEIRECFYETVPTRRMGKNNRPHDTDGMCVI